MGLIQAGLGALGGVLADQWKEYFYCESMSADTLVCKGEKRISGRSSNTKGNDNIISNGSIIAINEGQCMMIVEQGKIVEVCAEPGEYKYDTSTEPSIFAGSLGQSIKETFKLIGKRFTFGGDPAKDQRVYYFNTKEIVGNKYGTANPVPFRVVINEQLGYKLSVDIRCNGEYSYKITNPLLFYTNVCGNVADRYDRSEIDSMLKSEILNALQPALAKLSANGIQYYEIPAHTFDIRDALNEVLDKEWSEGRGIVVEKFNVNSLSIPEDQKKQINKWEETAMNTNIATAAASTITAANTAAVDAANNPNGALNGFIGMNAAGGLGVQGANLFGMAQQAQAQQPQAPAAPAAPANAWKCPKCGTMATGKFCPECGEKKPDNGAWKCPKCGVENTGKFCSECGEKKPEAAAAIVCPKCGWKPENPAETPKFCPECGTKL